MKIFNMLTKADSVFQLKNEEKNKSVNISIYCSEEVVFLPRECMKKTIAME